MSDAVPQWNPPPVIPVAGTDPSPAPVLAVKGSPELEQAFAILLAEPPAVKARPMPKVPRTAMRSYVHRWLKEQGGLCPLCGQPIDLTQKSEGVMDHNHDTGEVRGILHRSCNAAEGKVANAAGRWGAKSSSYADIVPFLENLVAYLKMPGKGMIYPTHKTPDEKREAVNAKARLRRAEAKAKLALRGRTKGT